MAIVRSRANDSCGPPKPRFRPVGQRLVTTTRLRTSTSATRYGPVMQPCIRYSVAGSGART